MSDAPEPGMLRRERAKKRLAAIAIIVVVGGGALWYFETSLQIPVRDIESFGTSAANSVLDQIQANFQAPPPLKSSQPAPPKTSTSLTRAGVIANTNLQRKENGDLPALAENTTLDDVATLRLDDMFEKQYFAHVGPDGESAETVASSVGYSYLALGENLALGNFPGDKGVVAAWMASPGHRANILDSHYTQIGVAVREGVFEGQRTWLAVQVFGRPSSDCAAPDVGLKAAIDAGEGTIASMGADLNNKKAAIDAMEPKSGPDYNQAVTAYNAEVAQYNALTAQVKTQIDQYNLAVESFNQCLGT